MTQKGNAGAQNGSNRKVIIAACISLVVVVLLVAGIMKMMENSSNKIGDVTIGAAYDYEEKGLLKLGEYKGLSLSVEVTDADVEEGVNDALESEEVYEHKEGRPVAEDTINIDYAASIEGQPLEDYSSKDEYFEVGSEDNFAEFNDLFVQMTTGETRSVDVAIPSDYGDDELDGKTVTFDITLNYICGEAITQELTDEFVSEYSEGKCTSVDGFNDYIRETLYNENVAAIADDVWEQVVENADVKEAFEGEVENAVKETMDNYESFAELSGCTVEELLESFGMTEEDARDVGKDMAKERMIAKTIAAKENIVMDDEKYKELLVNYMAEDDTEIADKSLEELESTFIEQYAENPRESMFLECVKKYVADNATVTGMK